MNCEFIMQQLMYLRMLNLLISVQLKMYIYQPVQGYPQKIRPERRLSGINTNF